jgi:oligoribonuclease NrnB/cAMP/cGMP phosphodiesterase (DHH superfamily)
MKYINYKGDNMEKYNCFIVYHGVDLDGYASAVLAAKVIEEKDEGKVNITFLPYNYEKEIKINDKFLIDVLQKEDKVYFLDCNPFQVEPDYMDKVLKKTGNKIIIVDHHKTTFEFLRKNNMIHNFGFPLNEAKWEGMVETTSGAACLLTWHYFFMEKRKMIDPPLVLNLISKYDTWNKDDAWDNYTLPFQYGVRAYDKEFDMKDPIKNSRLKELITKTDNIEKRDIENKEFVHQRIIDGIAVLNYVYKRNNQLGKLGKRCSLHLQRSSTDAEGRKMQDNKIVTIAFVATDYFNNSKLFEDYFDDNWGDYYAFVLIKPRIFEQNKCDVTIITNNLGEDDDDLNAASLCEFLGGGGHNNVGGISCNYKYDKSKNVFKLFNQELDG